MVHGYIWAQNQNGNKLPTAPWLLTPDQLKICDTRAAKITYLPGYACSCNPIFSKQWLMPVMESKIKASVLNFCFIYYHFLFF